MKKIIKFLPLLLAFSTPCFADTKTAEFTAEPIFVNGKYNSGDYKKSDIKELIKEACDKAIAELMSSNRNRPNPTREYSTDILSAKCGDNVVIEAFTQTTEKHYHRSRSGRGKTTKSHYYKVIPKGTYRYYRDK